MLHLLLVIKLVTVNAISWQTCDPHRIKKTTVHAPNRVPKHDKHDRDQERKEGERVKSKGRKSQFYLHVWPWSTSMTGISESALFVDR